MTTSRLRQEILNKYGSISRAGRLTGLGSQRISSAVLNHERGKKTTAPSRRMFSFILELEPEELGRILSSRKTHDKLINEA